jgi:hypothetical protein
MKPTTGISELILILEGVTCNLGQPQRPMV